MVSFKGAHFVKDIILTCVRWYVAYPLSYRQVEELMQERGVSVAPAPINRWLLQESLPLAEAFQRRRHLVWISWRMAAPLSQSQGTGARAPVRWSSMATSCTFSSESSARSTRPNPFSSSDPPSWRACKDHEGWE